MSLGGCSGGGGGSVRVIYGMSLGGCLEGILSARGEEMVVFVLPWR